MLNFIDPNAEVILSGNKIKEHNYSIILWKNPWYVMPININLDKFQLRELKKRYSIINIEKKIKYVENKLHSDEYIYELKEWSIIDENNEEETCLICFNVASYISYLFGVIDRFPEYNKYEINELHTIYGIFECELGNNIESHAFVIRFTDKKIRILSGYGGYEGIIDKTYDKERWIKTLQLLNSYDSIRQYNLFRRIFDLPKEIYSGIYDKYQKITFDDYIFMNRIA